jgi:hypothetical protein
VALRFRRLLRPRIIIAIGVFLLGLGVYRATSSPTINFWDCGEFITTSHILGIPHQPGTPLYVLMGRVFDILLGHPDLNTPSFSTAPAVNFMSILFSALALMMVYLIILDVARRADPDSGWLAHAGGVVGALFLLFSETFWFNAIEAEVYGLAAFMIALVTWLALRWYDTRDQERSDRILYLMVYLLGLGVGFHLGSLLVFPGIFVLVLVARERQLPAVDLLLLSVGLGLFLLSTMTRDDSLLLVALLVYVAVVVARAFTGRRFALYASGLFLLGLTVHLFMLVRAPLDPAINQSQPDDLATLMSVLRREQYPPINIFHRQASLLWQFRYYYDFFIEQFKFLSGSGFLPRAATFLGPIFLGLLGIFHGLRRVRRLFWMLLVNYFINADALTIYLNFSDHEVRERDYFYFAAFLFFAVFIGIGVAALLRYAAGPEGRAARELAPGEQVERIHAGWLPRAATAVLILVAALPLLQPGHSKWFRHDRSKNVIAREYAWNLLAGLDEGTILFTNGDNDTFPVWYLQEVERFRRDVTVVNLSLVNLPWYIKQMHHREPALPLSYTDAQIEKLRPRLLTDPRTGQQQLLYVRDFVVADIVRTNSEAAKPRPVFFAVTIPQENMALYFPYLQMEGLAYRLADSKSGDGMPRVNGDELLHNMLGVYDYDGMLTGDSEQRWRRYAELTGWHHDLPPGGHLASDGEPSPPVLERKMFTSLLADVGYKRPDVYRDENTRNLLGNYPAALVRAGYEHISRAQALSTQDTVSYDQNLDSAMLCFDMAARFEPTFEPVISFYPMILVDRGRSPEALAYLASVAGRIAPDLEERTVIEIVLSMGQVGEADMAASWLQEQIEERPQREFLYRALFELRWRQHDGAAARAIAQRYQAQFGMQDPEMVRKLAQLTPGPEVEVQPPAREGSALSPPVEPAQSGSTTQAPVQDQDAEMLGGRAP